MGAPCHITMSRVLNRNIAINIKQCRLGGCKGIAAAQWNTIPSRSFTVARQPLILLTGRGKFGCHTSSEEKADEAQKEPEKGLSTKARSTPSSARSSTCPYSVPGQLL